MKLIDIHNVVLSVLFSATSLALAPQIPFRVEAAVVSAIITFVFLGGRVLTHGIDLSKNDPRWKTYVLANLAFNICAAGVNSGIFMLLSR